jgi:hypothetical protein
LALNGRLRGKGVKDPKRYAVEYTASVRRLKEFLDIKYGRIDNYQKQHKY